MATLKKTSVVVAPIFTALDKDEKYLAEIIDIVESLFVKTGSFSIARHDRFEDYYYKHPEEKKNIPSYKDYLKIANEYGIEKMITLSLYRYNDQKNSMHITLKDAATDLTGGNITVQFGSLEELKNNPEILETFGEHAKTISIFDMIYILTLLLQIAIIVLILLKKNAGVLLETSIFALFLMFLFSFFYAKNANMDYFQKFIATQGQVTMAGDTATEQFYALARFAPLFLLNLVYLLMGKIGKLKNLDLKDRILSFGLFVSMLSAGLYAMQFPNNLTLWGIPALAWISLVPLFWLLANTTYLKGVYYGVVFGAVQSVLINFWQGTYSYIGLQIVIFGLVLEYVIFMFILKALLIKAGKFKIPLIACLWIIFEYARSIGFMGYPWGLAGSALFTFTPSIQIASITGFWGVSFLVLLINAALAWIADAWIKKKTPRLGLRFYLFPITAVSLFILNLIYGFISMALLDKAEQKAENYLDIVVVQQNTDPRKHDYQMSLDSLRDLTDQAIEELGHTPDLVVWPEGAFKPDIRDWLDRNPQYYSKSALVPQLIEYITGRGIYVVTGTQDHVFIPDEDYELVWRNLNSAALMAPDGSIENIYHKMKLVPFTEHFPYKKEFPQMWELLQKFDTSNWLAGWERKVLQTPEISFIGPICFEDAFPDHIRRFIPSGVDLIANMSNDYWSLSPVEGLQHGINGLFRAVENRRPMVRATCSGYTVFADAAGRIKNEASGFYTPDYLLVSIPDIERPLTFYTLHGDWFPKIFIYLLILYVLFLIVRPIYILLMRGKKRR